MCMVVELNIRNVLVVELGNRNLLSKRFFFGILFRNFLFLWYFYGSFFYKVLEGYLIWFYKCK